MKSEPTPLEHSIETMLRGKPKHFVLTDSFGTYLIQFKEIKGGLVYAWDFMVLRDPEATKRVNDSWKTWMGEGGAFVLKNIKSIVGVNL